MKKLLWIAVNYCSYAELDKLLFSISVAAANVPDISVHVAVADNTENNIQTIKTDWENIQVKSYSTPKNYGYLGGCRFVMSRISDISKYDYVVISNVDITVQKDCFVYLNKMNITDIGWIAPSIVSLSEKKDRNPKILTRQNKRHLQITKMLYICSCIYHWYVKYVYSKRKHVASIPQNMDIYAGHGSCMIFTKQAAIQNILHKYTPFLFCEEHFFAEEMRNAKLKVHYTPSICINDSDHINTGTMPGKQYCMLNRKAISFIINSYFL